MLDPLVSLAFAMHTNRGAYAVLVGSGVSRAAGIPTGWEVVLDLIRKVAAAQGQDCAPSPEAWYQNFFKEAPSYSVLLKRLAPRPAERQQLLRSYFERLPTDTDPTSKLPTKAHHAIAALAKTGHVRVIITTNFDRLVEQSLQSIGINPVVISTPNAADGAVPLIHAPCTVVKVHGDYLDTRIKNTLEELEKYDRRMNRLLDRVFDEFGVVICGWSAEWDAALRGSLERCTSRRYTTYWGVRGTPSAVAEGVIRHREAIVVTNMDADHLFSELRQKIEALTTFDPPHPLSNELAIASVKRFLSDERYRIDLHDLVHGELNKVTASIADEKMLVSGTVPFNATEVANRATQYESISSILRDIMITGCYWGSPGTFDLWSSVLRRLMARPETGGVTPWINLRRYPALLLYYAAGLSAIAKDRYDVLRSLFLMTFREGPEDTEETLVDSLFPQVVIEQATGQAAFYGGERRHTPLNDHLFEILRPSFRAILPEDRDYEDAFTTFEYLSAVLFVERATGNDGTAPGWVPLGRFGWQGILHREARAITRLKEGAKQAISWGPLQAGLFSSQSSFFAAAEHVAKARQKMRWY